MKILVLADQKSKYLYDFYEPDKLKDIDLIISCGDLSPSYLSFFVTLCNVPLLYVRGNHDDKYEKTPPDGCICIEDDIYVHDGILSWGWAVPWNIFRGPATSIRRRVCADGCVNCVISCGGTGDSISL